MKTLLFLLKMVTVVYVVWFAPPVILAVDSPTAYPTCLEGRPLNGRTDTQLMATFGSCGQTDIRHFALLTAKSWDVLTWHSAGNYCGFEYEGTGMYPDPKPSGNWPEYQLALEIFVNGQRQGVTPGEIIQQFDCRRTAGAGGKIEFHRLDMMLATLQWV